MLATRYSAYRAVRVVLATRYSADRAGRVVLATRYSAHKAGRVVPAIRYSAHMGTPTVSGTLPHKFSRLSLPNNYSSLLPLDRTRGDDNNHPRGMGTVLGC